MTSSVQQTWNLGYTMLMNTPFIGLATIVFDLPLWLEIVAVAAIVGLVFFGSRNLFRKQGGWQPSKTLPEQRSDNDH